MFNYHFFANPDLLGNSMAEASDAWIDKPTPKRTAIQG